MADMLNPVIPIVSEKIKADGVLLLVNFGCQTAFQQSKLRLGDHTFKNRILNALPIILTFFGHSA